MRAVVAHIVHPAEVNKRLMQLERLRGSSLFRVVLLMEKAEPWAVDDIRMNAQGDPIGVDDERGSGQERLESMQLLERLLNSDAMAEKLRTPGSAKGETGAGLIDVLALLRTGRFLVCLHHISTVSEAFISEWLDVVLEKARSGDVMAHVLRARLTMLKRADMIQTVFSKEAARQVVKCLEGVK